MRSSATFAHTVSPGAYRLLVVAVMIEGNESVTSASFDGIFLTKATDSGTPPDGNSGARVEHWYLVAPPVVTADVVVTFASNVDPSGIAAVDFTSVDQLNPIGATAINYASSGTNASTGVLTLFDESLIFGAVFAQGGDTAPFTPGTGIVELWDAGTGSHQNNDAGLWGGDLVALLSGAHTFSAAFSADDGWAIAAIEIVAAVTPPDAPSNLTATVISDTQIDLSWSDNSDNETGFEIEWSTSGAGGPFSLLTTVPGGTTAYQDLGLDPETEYCYQVRAVNLEGPSAYTSVDCATTLACSLPADCDDLDACTIDDCVAGVCQNTPIGPPQILTQPQSQGLCEGDDAVFTISAAGTGMLHYQWYQDGSRNLFKKRIFGKKKL